MENIARDMVLYSDGRCILEDKLDSFETSLELACELLVLETTAQLSIPQKKAFGLVCSALTSLRSVQEESTRSRYTQSFNAVLINSGSVGQLSLKIPYSQLHFPIENQLPFKLLKKMGTLVRTIEKIKCLSMGYQSETSFP